MDIRSPLNIETFDQNNSFDLSHGFLPNKDPIQALPDSLSIFDDFAKSLPVIIYGSNYREKVMQLPEMDVSMLTTGEHYERAMMLLSFVAHAYIWCQPNNAANTLPAHIARPWCAIADVLQRKPVQSYASYALYNWYRIDSDGPLELGNIALLQNFLAGIDEQWFILIHIAIEAAIIDALKILPDLQQALKAQDTDNIILYLKTMQQSLTSMNTIMARMPEHCDPYIYFERVRPFIHGWDANPALPDGLIYEGVEKFENKPQKFKGETGAQSTIIPAMDAILGIEHQNSPLTHHLEQMQIYMPKSHRAFLHQLLQGPSVKFSIDNQSITDTQIIDLYNDCVKQIDAFRQIHLQFAKSYIQKQAQKDHANPTETGTGGTPFIRYLSEHEKETTSALTTDT